MGTTDLVDEVAIDLSKVGYAFISLSFWTSFLHFLGSFQLFQASDFVAQMDILSSKLEVCLPLAYTSTIYKHFSSLMPFRKLCSNMPVADRSRGAQKSDFESVSLVQKTGASKNVRTFKVRNFSTFSNGFGGTKLALWR